MTSVEDQLGAEDLRRLNRRRPPAGRVLIGLLIAALAFGAGWQVGQEGPPAPTRVILRPPAVCLQALTDAENAVGALHRAATAAATGASADEDLFLQQYSTAEAALTQKAAVCRSK